MPCCTVMHIVPTRAKDCSQGVVSLVDEFSYVIRDVKHSLIKICIGRVSFCSRGNELTVQMKIGVTKSTSVKPCTLDARIDMESLAQVGGGIGSCRYVSADPLAFLPVSLGRKTALPLGH